MFFVLSFHDSYLRGHYRQNTLGSPHILAHSCFSIPTLLLYTVSYNTSFELFFHRSSYILFLHRFSNLSFLQNILCVVLIIVHHWFLSFRSRSATEAFPSNSYHKGHTLDCVAKVFLFRDSHKGFHI